MQLLLKAKTMKVFEEKFLEKITRLLYKRSKESFNIDIDKMPLPELGNALAGEVGEACNIIKKINRRDFNIGDLNIKLDLGKELSDIIFYVLMLSKRSQIDIESALVQKFNEISTRIDSSLRLPYETVSIQNVLWDKSIIDFDFITRNSFNTEYPLSLIKENEESEIIGRIRLLRTKPTITGYIFYPKYPINNWGNYQVEISKFISAEDPWEKRLQKIHTVIIYNNTKNN